MIRFNKDILNLIHKHANLDSKTSTEFMHDEVLKKFEDSLDYQAANNKVRIVNFFDSPEAKVTKKSLRIIKLEQLVTLPTLIIGLMKSTPPLIK